MISTVQRHSPQRPITFINLSSETVPPYAAMQIRSVDLNDTYYIQKPDADDLSPQKVILNGPTSVKPNGSGTAQGSIPYRAMFNLDDGPTDNRESVGTRAGFWSLYLGFEGFLVRGQPDEAIGEIVVQPNLTCRELVDGRYYYYGSGTPPPDRCVKCCGCDKLGMSGIGGIAPFSLNVTITPACVTTPFTFVINGDISLFPLPGTTAGENLCPDTGPPPNEGLNISYFGNMQEEYDDFTLVTATPCDGSTPFGVSTLIKRRASLALKCRWYRTNNRGICSFWNVSASFDDTTGGVWKAGQLTALDQYPSDSVSVIALASFCNVNPAICPAGCPPNLNQLGCNPLQFQALGNMYCAATDPPCDWGIAPYTPCVGSAFQIDITE